MLFKLTKLTKIILDSFFLRALFKGVAAGVEHKPVLRGLGEIKHVVDIGANRGQFALVARRCFAGAKIDSFEPLEEPRQKFQAVFAADSNVRLHPVAIGERTGDEVIHVSRRDDSSSLLPITGEQVNLFPETAEKEVRVIQVATLNEIFEGEEQIDTPSLLKIDVQGYELPVLRGCTSLLHRFKYVYVECSFVELYAGQALADEVIHFLRSNKFRLTGVHNVFYSQDGKAIQADFLFESVSIG